MTTARTRARLLLVGAVVCALVLVPAAALAAVALVQGTILVDQLPPPDSGIATSPEYEALGRQALVRGAVAVLALAGLVACAVLRQTGPTAARR
ncbi:hypothetical protein BFL34_00088 [Clavibacter michiganensis]|uniref:Integral membrane protein n=1 Tax=Clavibacter michiganensis TaxID=28447 RepID=A0A251YEI7_9MICO|nr:hypothetical protein [Clavibacter michiganensis]OUE22563.1 hypothetical protein BFL34_00088 [Clavibacter michiganensis]